MSSDHMVTKPKLSVIVTTHARHKLLARALASLRAQTYCDFEVVLCADEGSRETLYTAAEYLREHDTFLQVPHLKGPSQTRNLGIQVAKGDWLLFLDDDDVFEQEYFKNISLRLDATHNIFIVNYTNLFNGVSGQVQERAIDTSCTSLSSLLVQNFIPINSIVISRETALIHQFNSQLQTHEDWDWLLCLYSDMKNRWKHISIFGPRIYLDTLDSRNKPVKSDVGITLDYLSIYRRWPAADHETQILRANLLASRGFAIPPEFL